MRDCRRPVAAPSIRPKRLDERLKVRDPDAVAAYGEALKLGPRMVDAYSRSQVVNDPLLGPFARLPRARAWLGMGPAGVPGAVADANALVRAWPRDAFAHLGAARIHARAASGNARAATALRERALKLLSRAVELEPGLRKRLADDPDLEALRDDPRFKRLAGG